MNTRPAIAKYAVYGYHFGNPNRWPYLIGAKVNLVFCKSHVGTEDPENV